MHLYKHVVGTGYFFHFLYADRIEVGTLLLSNWRTNTPKRSLQSAEFFIRPAIVLVFRGKVSMIRISRGENDLTIAR